MAYITYQYLRASTAAQNASRAEESNRAFAAANGLTIVDTIVENESGSLLARPKLMELINKCDKGNNNVLLIESCDRLSRLAPEAWDTLKGLLKAKNIKIVACDLPTTLAALKPAEDGNISQATITAVNDMLIDIMAAQARKDYLLRRERAAQGTATAKAKGLLKGKQEDKARNAKVVRLLKEGKSWSEVVILAEVSKSQVAKIAKKVKEEQQS